MIRVGFVRGSYLNNYEAQNYYFHRKDIQLTGISSLFPIHQCFHFPVIKLISVADIPMFKRGVKFISNRTLGDSQILFGLESQAQNFDILHTADPHYYYSYQLALMRQLKRIKHLLVTSWETIPFNNEGTLSKKRIKRFVLKAADHFICYSLRAKDSLVLEGISEKKISTIPLGVDLKRMENKKSKSNNLSFLFIGRLVEEKGVLDAYNVFRKVIGKVSGGSMFTFTIAGGGPLKSTLEKQIHKDSLDQRVTVQLYGYEEIPSLYHNADIVILPSKSTSTWEEQYGMVFLESMAAGIPIVAYDSGSVSELVQDAGLLSAEGNLDQLTKSVLQLIADKNLREKIGTIGRERAVKHFDSQNSAKKIQNLYHQLYNS